MTTLSKTAVALGTRKGIATRVKSPATTLAENALALLERVKTVHVQSQPECAAAATLLHDIRAQRTQWAAHEKPVVVDAKRSYDTARDRFNQIDKPLKNAEESLKAQIGAFKLAAQRLAEATAKGANQTLLDRQTAALEQQTDSIAAAAKAAIADRDAAVLDAEAAGDHDRARRLAAAPLDIAVPDALDDGMALLLGPGDLADALQPEDGIGVGESWTFEITDPAQVPDDYWSVDPAKIKAVVAILKGKTRIPGVRVYSKPKVSIR